MGSNVFLLEKMTCVISARKEGEMVFWGIAKEERDCELKFERFHMAGYPVLKSRSPSAFPVSGPGENEFGDTKIIVHAIYL